VFFFFFFNISSRALLAIRYYQIISAWSSIKPSILCLANNKNEDV